MIKNYLTITIRHLLRQRLHTAISLIGLTIGITASLIALLHVHQQFQYHTHHENIDRIYRIILDRGTDGHIAGVSGALKEMIEQSVPEIQTTARVWPDPVKVVYDGRSLGWEAAVCVDPTFFNIFDVAFVRGDPETAFANPYSIVVSERTAKRIFGDQDPIGQVLDIRRRYWLGLYTVTGIVKDDGNNSIYPLRLLHCTPPTSEYPLGDWEGWVTRMGNRHWLHNYVTIDKGADLRAIEQKLTAMLHPHIPEVDRDTYRYVLQPLRRIHLYSLADYDIWSGGDIEDVYLYAGLAGLILLIACSNFVNLSTAQSTIRSREVGIRKVSGARRSQLIAQFVGESVFLSLLAGVLAIGLTELVLPWANTVLMPLEGIYGPRLAPLTFTLDAYWIGLLAAVCLTVGLIGGIYPALFLSSYKPDVVLRGAGAGGSFRSRIRQSLVVTQFALSILLIIGTVTMHRQITYVSTMDLGFDRDEIFLMPIFEADMELQPKGRPWLSERFLTVRERFARIPGVQAASTFRFVPGRTGGYLRTLRPEGWDQAQPWMIPVQQADDQFLETFELTLLAGRNFERDGYLKSPREYLINETAAKELGWYDEAAPNPWAPAIGKRISNKGGAQIDTRIVIGVVKDYHYGPANRRIGPTAITYIHKFLHGVAIRMPPSRLPEALPEMKRIWESYNTDDPFRIDTVDTVVMSSYGQELATRRHLTIFSGIALGLAGLGLFGLASFSVERRTKEVGIRKALGAPVSGLAGLLSTEFLRLVAIANLIAWPIGYYAADQWLNQYAYRVSLGPTVFVASGLVAAAIAVLTVGYHTVKTARSNPVDALRYE